MSKLNFEYVPLTFISDKQEIKRQIRNTLILIYLFEKYNTPVRLEKLIECTQYGYNASAMKSGRNKFLRISDIHDSKVNWDTVPFCNCTDTETYLLKNEDILIARTGGTTGKSFKINNPPKNSIYAGYLIRIRAKENVNPDYIYLFLHSHAYWSQIVNLNERNFRPKANAENLKALILPECPKNIQDEVVKISQGENISGYEDLLLKIEYTLNEYDKTQQIENLLSDQLIQIENVSRAILHEAFQGKLIQQEKKVEAASVLLNSVKALSGKKQSASLKQEEIPFDIPNSWVWCRMGEIVQHNSGKTLDSGRNKGTQREYITTSNLYWGYFELHKLKTILIEENELERCTALKGDLLICEGGEAGRAAIWDFDYGVCFQNHIHRIRPYGNINSTLIYRYFQYLHLSGGINKYRKGMGISNLSGKAVSSIVFPLPPLSEQKRIVSEIENQFSKINQLKEHVTANQAANEQLIKAVLNQAYKLSMRVELLPLVNNKLPVLQEQEENHFVKRKILASYIINQSLNDSRFGDVKFEKLLHLSDYFALKRNLGQKYFQQAAGPYDNAFTRAYFQQIESSKWFKRTRSGNQFVFSAGQNHSKSTNTYGYFSDEELKRVDGIISYFKKYDYEQPEIISTLYAVWNNRIVKQEPITDALLKQDFLNWDAQKIKYKDRLDAALNWMRKENFVPDGWGKVIEKAKKNGKRSK